MAGRGAGFGRLAGLGLAGLLAVAMPMGAGAESCTAAAEPGTPSAAEQAMKDRRFPAAEEMFRKELAAKPGDEAATAGLVRALREEEKLDEALQVADQAIAAHAGSALLLTERAGVQIRQGNLWEAAGSAEAAVKADPCLAQAHARYAELYLLSSMYASAKRQIDLAQRLDPWDGWIHSEWMASRTKEERIAEAERVAADKTNEGAQKYLADLKQEAGGQGCRLVSQVSSTELPFAPMMYDATNIRAYGLDVKLNDKGARLEIDTGASGLLVSRAVADRAGLKPFGKEMVEGVGDEGAQDGFLSFATSIKIGDLEFQNCRVEVMGGKRLGDSDGLIGMDVFSSFLVTLNYPLHRLKLEPLPPRPGESGGAMRLGIARDTDWDYGAEGGMQNRYVAPQMKDYLEIYRRGHDLLVPVGLNKSKLKLFILDSGAWATTISTAAGREVSKLHADDALEVKGLGGKVNKVFVADDVTFQFGNKAQRQVYVPSFDLSGTSRNLGIEVSGFLGARTLQLMTVHIDYRDGLVGFDYDPKTAGYLNQKLAR